MKKMYLLLLMAAGVADAEIVNNRIESFTHGNLPVLEFFNCSGNNLSNLDMSAVLQLEYLHSDNNQLNKLLLRPGLQLLKCINNQFATLDLTGMSDLYNVDFSNNQVAAIDFSDLPGSYDIQCDYNLLSAIDDIVDNTANIYFDYNSPISTNTARTTFAQLSSQQFAVNESILIHPNPVKDKVKISAKSELQSIEVYDVGGRILEKINENKNSAEIDFPSKAKGIYFFKINTSDGSKIEKIVKQ